MDFAKGHYHFNHSSVGKKTHPQGMAAAKVRYMARKSACIGIIAVGVAIPNAALVQQQKVIEKHFDGVEKSSRANARIADAFHVALPNCMTDAERRETVNSFLWAVTKHGEAAAFGFIHADNPGNHHFHALVSDRSLTTGRRVQMLSEKGSTERMRSLWQEICNQKLAEFNYDIRIDHRIKREQELEALQSPEVPLASQTESADTSVEEADMDIEKPPYVHVREAIGHDLERQFLHAVQGQVAHYERTEARARADQARLSEVARAHRREAMEAEKLAAFTADSLKDYTKPNGCLRGFGFRVLGYDVKSPRRAKGERLSAEKARHENRHLSEQSNAVSTEYSAQMAENEAREALLSAEAEKRQLDALVRGFGDRATLETADQILQQNIQESLSKASIEEIYAFFELGELTGAEAVRAFELLGEHAMVDAVKQRMAIEEEMDPKGSYEEEHDDGIGI